MTETENDLFELLLTYFSRGRFEDELLGARKQYELSVGPIRADEPREGFIINCFHSWYLFTRKIREHIKPPARLALEESELGLTAEQKGTIEGWLSNVHSLFIIKKCGNEALTVKDLIGEEKYKIDGGPYLKLLQKNEILEARIFRNGDTWDMLPGICVHPIAGKKYIETEIKKVKHLSQDIQVDLFLHLEKCRLKIVHYANMQVEAFYNAQPIF